MPTAEAHIETGRPSRYLAQLCRHVSNIYGTDRHLQNRRRRHAAGGTRARPEWPPHIEWSETHGTITVGDSKITMVAEPGALTLRAEAADEEALRRIQDLVTGLLDRFGRRDHLAVTWSRPGMHTVQPADAGQDVSCRRTWPGEAANSSWQAEV